MFRINYRRVRDNSIHHSLHGNTKLSNVGNNSAARYLIVTGTHFVLAALLNSQASISMMFDLEVFSTFLLIHRPRFLAGRGLLDLREVISFIMDMCCK